MARLSVQIQSYLSNIHKPKTKCVMHLFNAETSIYILMGLPSPDS